MIAAEPTPPWDQLLALSKARCFIDTNVLVYADSTDEPRKQRIAIDLLRHLRFERLGVLSTQVGFALVALFMVVVYKGFGLIANVALFLNVAILVAVMGALGAALSLPGIAGIVLTIGMAVDANVLIYERIREELRDGKSAARAIELGFERAFSAILDSNITGIITAVIMFMIGSGAVRGFAVTTGIGIFTSMFTAVYVTRLIVTTYINWKQPKELVV